MALDQAAQVSMRSIEALATFAKACCASVASAAGLGAVNGGPDPFVDRQLAEFSELGRRSGGIQSSLVQVSQQSNRRWETLYGMTAGQLGALIPIVLILVSFSH